MNTIGSANTSQPDFLSLTGLSRGARDLYEVLRRTPIRYAFCFRGNEWLAWKLGCSVRTVQRYLKELRVAGWIEVIIDKALNSGRKIALLWRTQSPSPSKEETADDCRVASSLDPSPASTKLPNPEPSPALPSPEPEREEPGPEAPAEEVDRVVRMAETLYHKPLKAEVVRAAKEHQLSMVERALEVAEKARSYSWRYVEGVLRNWRERPPSDKPKLGYMTMASIDAGIALLAERQRQRDLSRG